jgi:hypothetical protein
MFCLLVFFFVSCTIPLRPTAVARGRGKGVLALPHAAGVQCTATALNKYEDVQAVATPRQMARTGKSATLRRHVVHVLLLISSQTKSRRFCLEP